MTFFQQYDAEPDDEPESPEWYRDSCITGQKITRRRHCVDKNQTEDWLSSFKTNAEVGAAYDLSTSVIGQQSDALMSQTKFVLSPDLLDREQNVQNRKSISAFTHPLSCQHINVDVLENSVADFARRMTNSKRVTHSTENEMMSGDDLWVGATARPAIQFIIDKYDDIVFIDYIQTNKNCQLWACSNLKNSTMLKQAVTSIISLSNQRLPEDFNAEDYNS